MIIQAGRLGQLPFWAWPMVAGVCAAKGMVERRDELIDETDQS